MQWYEPLEGSLLFITNHVGQNKVDLAAAKFLSNSKCHDTTVSVADFHFGQAVPAFVLTFLSLKLFSRSPCSAWNLVLSYPFHIPTLAAIFRKWKLLILYEYTWEVWSRRTIHNMRYINIPTGEAVSSDLEFWDLLWFQEAKIKAAEKQGRSKSRSTAGNAAPCPQWVEARSIFARREKTTVMNGVGEIAHGCVNENYSDCSEVITIPYLWRDLPIFTHRISTVRWSDRIFCFSRIILYIIIIKNRRRDDHSAEPPVVLIEVVFT